MYGDSTSLEFIPPSVDHIEMDWFKPYMCGYSYIDEILGVTESLPLESHENEYEEEYVMLQDAYDPNRRWVLEQWVESVRQRLILERLNNEEPVIMWNQ